MDPLGTGDIGGSEANGLSTCPEGGGGTPLYKLHRYVAPHRVGFLHGFGLKTGLVFERTTGAYKRIYHLNSK